MPKYKILKLNAKQLITRCETEGAYTVNFDNSCVYNAVVDELLNMENCALFDQFMMLLGQAKKEAVDDCLLHELIIVDFTDIYKKKSSEIFKTKVEQIITSGFTLCVDDKKIHMMPFDKSGNMSRKCRISFINSKRLNEMNKRLNLAIDFSNIKVNLSKYYAYRGLYLSTATRIEHQKIIFTPETIVVIKDIQDYARYGMNVSVLTGDVGKETPLGTTINFESQEIPKENISVPYDGQGLISPIYSKYINEALHTTEQKANSFQIRLPFAKGMLHNVDFHAFLAEFEDENYNLQDSYMIEDAFGIKRDIKKAQIILPQSMFKCFDWLRKHCKSDPMQFYCDKIKEYNHALYISSTDIPYGHSKVTHLTYQMLNTLDLTKKQFDNLISDHLKYIENPIRYIELCKGQYVSDNDLEYKAKYTFPNWQRAVIANPAFSKLKYIKERLANIQSSLMTKLVLGKLVVEGQTRYLVRDLIAMMVLLIQNPAVRKDCVYKHKLFNYRFYLPQTDDNIKLEYFKAHGFLRSPHLSRNEESALIPLVHRKDLSDDYNKIVDVYNKYCSHLTGVVMVGNESFDPMALGGADFDGDLVTMVAEENVVNAILSGCYSEIGKKKLPLVKIPSITASKEIVAETIPFSLVDNTFSDRIGIISNAAISIGQKEYGQNQKTNFTCAQCTVLTGLEIDAAKNGCRPNIESCLKIEPCEYLKFKKNFEKLKANKKYHFNQLEYKKENTKNCETHILSLEGVKPIKYIKEKGTFITELPIIFMENLKIKLNIPYNKKSKYFKFPKSNVDSGEYKKQCQNVLEIYDYYRKIQKQIFEKIKKEYNYSTNIENLLWIQYDKEKAEQIIQEILPRIYSVVENKINSKEELGEIKNKLNNMQWHLMNTEKKKDAIIEMFGLTNEQFSNNQDAWEVVLNSYQHGYKLLWYIVMDSCKSLEMDYKEFLDNLNLDQVFEICSLSDSIEKNMSCSFKNKEIFGEKQIYDLCLESLQNIISKSKLDTAVRMATLFEITKSKNKQAAFFWDSFSWEDISKFIVKENDNA